MTNKNANEQSKNPKIYLWKRWTNESKTKVNENNQERLNDQQHLQYTLYTSSTRLKSDMDFIHTKPEKTRPNKDPRASF